MIKYKLICKQCDKTFDSWFSSSKEFDKLKKINLINCNFCNSLKVEKSLMSPQVINKFHNENNISDNEKKIKKLKKIK